MKESRHIYSEQKIPREKSGSESSGSNRGDEEKS